MDNRSKLILNELGSYFSKLSGNDFENIDDLIKDTKLSEKKVTVDEVIEAIHEDPDIRYSVRGFKVRTKPPELNSDPHVILSKKLAAILRHGILKCGLKIYKGSYVDLDEMLKMETLKDFTKKDIYEVVNSNDKKRYDIIKDDSGIELIGAVQGHSIQVENLDLKPIDDNIRKAYHATFYSNWSSIKEIGLKKMGRNHIHLYTSNFGNQVRDLAEIIIEIDIPQAMSENIKFYVSKNNVILTEGHNGILSKKYFIKAWDLKTKDNLYHRKSKN